MVTQQSTPPHSFCVCDTAIYNYARASPPQLLTFHLQARANFMRARVPSIMCARAIKKVNSEPYRLIGEDARQKTVLVKDRGDTICHLDILPFFEYKLTVDIATK